MDAAENLIDPASPAPAGAASALTAGSEDLLWRLKRTQALASMGGWEWNLRTGERLWSEEIRDLFGLPPGDAFDLHTAIRESVHSDDRVLVEAGLRQAIDEGANYDLHHRIVRPDGEVLCVRSYGEIEHDGAGDPVRLRGIVQDVSGLRALERSASRSRDMLSGLFRISPEAIIVANEQGRVVVFSGGAETVFGHAAHEIVGADIERLMPERFRANHRSHVARFASGLEDSLQMAQRTPVRGLRKDGVEIPIEASLARIKAGGETLFITIVRDLSEQYLNEACLVDARDRAEQANQAKSTFLANMSHELRTPLNGILGVAQVLARSATEPRQREMIDLIETSACALEALLTDILDLSQIEAGRMAVQREPFDLAAMLRSVAALFETSARNKGLSFDLNLPDVALRGVVGDEKRLRQVLNNLLSNAVKFTETGGVSLTVTMIGAPETRRVRFVVRDTGIGFNADTGARLFNPFEQADSSITRRFGGTGLGLSICRMLVKLMGGTIEAESVPGQGSVFSFEIPLEPIALEPDEDAERPVLAAPFAHLRILLAEDHPVNRQVVELMLEPTGADLSAVENGDLAVAEAAAQPFDLILMDMQMPVMDGLEAVRRIRARERADGRPATPICMLTANAVPTARESALEAGANGFLTKPIGAQALIQQVALLTLGTDAAEEETRSQPDPGE